jgi:phosphatidate cytidylyltransferase
MLSTRILTAAILISLVLAALFLMPPLGWALATLAAIVVASYEWAALAGFGKRSGVAFVVVTALGGLDLVFASHFERGFPDSVVLVACIVATAFWIVVAPVWLARRAPATSPIARALAGWVVLIGAWVAIVELQARSAWLVLAAMAVVWIADTAAYFCGRAFGKHKLAPRVSPGKTWEGVYGALALVALSIVGDLTESLLKRNAGVKDSGRLLPGHGGVLDRIDALLAAMPPSALIAWGLFR